MSRDFSPGDAETHPGRRVSRELVAVIRVASVEDVSQSRAGAQRRAWSGSLVSSRRREEVSTVCACHGGPLQWKCGCVSAKEPLKTYESLFYCCGCREPVKVRSEMCSPLHEHYTIVKT